MRSDASTYSLTGPGTLSAVLEALTQDSATPIAGGTELMVALCAGRLPHANYVSIQGIPELRFLDDTAADTLRIGANTTFTDLRRSAIIAAEFPLIAQTAGWTGSIANQNRGTLGGNIANASPAADTPPALLAYDAELELISARGTRTMPYADFHLSYKKTALAQDELILAVRLPRRFRAHQHFVRKVGTRNAQAISKIALAAVALVENDRIANIRLGAASLRDRPCRLYATEAALLHQPLNAATMQAARAALASEVAPIDDIRSTARYRSHVAGNLLEEFLQSLQS